MALPELASELLASHDAFRGALAAAAAAAVYLVVDPKNPDAAQQRREAQHFVRESLAHMREEESTVFPDALECGVPFERVMQLHLDHAGLRKLARALEPRLARSSLDDETALMLLRYVHAFELHVAREEWALAHP